MSKPHKFKIDGLTPGQQEYVRRWLFVDNISCEDASARCQKEFGLSVSRESLRRWYAAQEKQQLQDRALKGVLDRAKESSISAQAQVTALKDLKDPYWDALMGMVGQDAFEKRMGMEAAPDIATLADLQQIALAGIQARTEALKLKQKDEQLSQGRTKLELELQKYKDKCQAASDQVKKLREKGSDLNDEERSAILNKVDEILGIK